MSTIMKLDTSHVSITDKLQDLIDAKADMKTALQEKGVTPTGGLSTYADEIRGIIPPVENVVLFNSNKYLNFSGSMLTDKIAFEMNDLLFASEPTGTSIFNYIDEIKSCPMILITDITDINTFKSFMYKLQSRYNYNLSELKIGIPVDIFSQLSDTFFKDMTVKGYKITSYYD